MPCNACTTALSPASSRCRAAASRSSRPVNPGLRAGMFHTRSTLPGGSGPEPSHAWASSRNERSTSLPSWSGLAKDCVTSPLARTRRRNASCRAPNA